MEYFCFLEYFFFSGTSAADGLTYVLFALLLFCSCQFKAWVWISINTNSAFGSLRCIRIDIFVKEMAHTEKQVYNIIKNLIFWFRWCLIRVFVILCNTNYNKIWTKYTKPQKRGASSPLVLYKQALTLFNNVFDENVAWIKKIGKPKRFIKPDNGGKLGKFKRSGFLSVNFLTGSSFGKRVVYEYKFLFFSLAPTRLCFITFIHFSDILCAITYLINYT